MVTVPKATANNNVSSFRGMKVTQQCNNVVQYIYIIGNYVNHL